MEPHTEDSNDQNRFDNSAGNSPASGGGFDFDYIKERAKKVVTDPVNVWDEIKAENLSPKEVYMKYVIVLAAIAPIATYIGMVVFGVSLPFAGTYRWPIFGGLVTTIMNFAMSLVVLAVAAFVVEKLGPKFNAKPTFANALQLFAFSATPAYLGGIFNLIPILSLLGALLSIYSLYILYKGFPKMTGAEGGYVGYFVASLVGTFLALVFLSFIVSKVSPVGAQHMAGGPVTFDSADGSPDKIELPGGVTVDVNKFQEQMKQLESMVPQDE